MSTPCFEVVIDHNAPDHGAQMARATRDLFAWAKQQGCLQVTREERELRPGVRQLRFCLDPKGRARPASGDTLVLSRKPQA
ncbi:hypothetical protein J7643_00095 [bacterium]|nr:hypothetical protein [bacterium]